MQEWNFPWPPRYQFERQHYFLHSCFPYSQFLEESFAI